jgi:cytochrome bd ubiquinol oxidase subunit II
MLHFLYDYATLRLIWWCLLGVLLIGFAVMDGFDMGVGTLLPFVARSDGERRVAINTIGPVWEGNQVWLILGGGAIFAAWPALYALSFSGFYLAMFLVLAALILRPVAMKYRSKQPEADWRRNWDWALFISGAVPALIFGVAVGNALRGVPFHFTPDLRPIYEGSLIGLLNPLALYCGILSLAMIAMHGAAWLTMKTEGAIAERASALGGRLAIATAGLFGIGGILVNSGLLGGYEVVGSQAMDGPSNPLLKSVVVQPDAWLTNFARYPGLWTLPALGVLGPLIAFAGFRIAKGGIAFTGSALGITGIIATVGVSMFPFIFPSSSNPNHSLTVFDASSSEATLRIMLLATVVFLPIVLAYTSWVYRVMWGKVREEDIEKAGSSAY